MASGKMVHEIKDTLYLLLALLVIVTVFSFLLYNYPEQQPVTDGNGANGSDTNAGDSGSNGNNNNSDDGNGLVIQPVDLPDQELCEIIDYGWSCTLTNDDNWYDQNRDKFYMVDTEFRDACEEQGGTWVCYGYCEPIYDHYCDFPRFDAEKECRNSGECSDKCTISFDYMDTQFPDRVRIEDVVCPDCTGSCSEYTLRFCDWWYELNNGIIEDHTGIMCD